MRKPRVLPLICFLTFCLSSVSLAAEEMTSLQAAFLRGEYAEVAQQAQQLLAKEPSLRDEVLYLQGVSYLKLRDLTAARSAMDRLTSQFPKSRWRLQAWIAVGDTYTAEGRHEEALTAYRRALGLGQEGEGGIPEAALRLAHVQRRLGLWQEAKNSFESLISRYPRSIFAKQAQEVLGEGDFFFSVQVGAFQSRENAFRLTAELKRRDFAADVNDALVEGKRFYRIRVGQFTNRDEAVQEVQRLRSEGFPGKVVP